MTSLLRSCLRTVLTGTAALLVLVPVSASAQKPKTAGAKPAMQMYPQDQAKQGFDLFEQNCAFCHGRFAQGGETGPDLTRSNVVKTDNHGDKIGFVVSNGRMAKGMPKFSFSQEQLSDIVAFLHNMTIRVEMNPGGRKGVSAADLQTGNAALGKQYFNGAGGCSSCHSPTGDLAGINNRLRGLALEENMLYPHNAKRTATVTLPSGKAVSGTVQSLDDFTVTIKEADGWTHSWRRSQVKLKVSDPAEAHVRLFPKYTDADIHNLMAYLQSLK